MSDKKPVIVTCPPSMNKFRVPSFGAIFGAGANPVTNPKLMIFLLRFPSKVAHIDPMECIEKGWLTREQVAELGYEVPAVDSQGNVKLDAAGNPVKVDVPIKLDIEIPEHVPDFAKMSIPELKDWCDDDRHPVKYGKKWSKEQYINACQSAVRKLQAE